MGVVTASEVISKARVLLNDVGDVMATDAQMLPLIQLAFDELMMEFDQNQIDTARYESSVVLVDLGESSIAVSEMLYPLSVYERPAGSTSDFIEMNYIRWTTDFGLNQDGPALNVWAWYGDSLRVPTALTRTEVVVRYIKYNTPPTTVGSSLIFQRIERFLIHRVASLFASRILQDEQRAQTEQSDALIQLNTLVSILVKQTHKGGGSRRGGFMHSYRSNKRRRI
jgi:hypothetical protein